MSNETLRRLENEVVLEDQADPILIVAVAEVLDCPVEELSPLAAESAVQVNKLITRRQPPPRRGKSGLGKRPSECNAIIAA